MELVTDTVYKTKASQNYGYTNNITKPSLEFTGTGVVYISNKILEPIKADMTSLATISAAGIYLVDGSYNWILVDITTGEVYEKDVVALG